MMNWRDIPRHDWRLIRASLLWFACALLLATLALLFNLHYRRHGEYKLQQLQTSLHEARAATERAQHEYLSAEQNQSHYQKLQASGILAPEQRLEWLALLNQARADGVMPQLRYRIEAQKPLEHATPSGNSMLYASHMALQYHVQHEAAFSVAHRLFANVSGRVMPLRCQISRDKAIESTHENTPLAVNCDYLWLTIAPVEVPADKAPTP